MEDQHHQGKEIMPFDKDEASRFVGENAFDIHWNPHDTKFAGSACVDDREYRQWGDPIEPLPPARIPGGGLGLLMDAIAGLNLFEIKRGRKGGFGFDCAEIVSKVEKIIGDVSYHSDEDSERQHGFACQGCGHLASALASPDDYLLPPHAANYFKNTYLPELKSRGIEPIIYKGGHQAGAVFVVDADDVGLPSSASADRHAYVYGRALHEKALSEIAKSLLSVVVELYPGATKEEVIGAFLEAGRVRLNQTIGRLAATLPQFRVFRNEGKQVLVERIIPVIDRDDETPEARLERQ